MKELHKKIVPAPDHLSDRSKQLWRQIAPRHAETAGRRTLLQSALEALDRADECRVAIAATGLTTTTEKTGAVHINPLAKLEREARQTFAKMWALLGLHFHGNGCIEPDDDEGEDDDEELA